MAQAYKDEKGDLIIDISVLDGAMLDYWTLRVCAKTHEEAIGLLADGANPSENWDLGGLIIEQNKIATSPIPPDMTKWVAIWPRLKQPTMILPRAVPSQAIANAARPLVAAMRALVAGVTNGTRVAVPPDVQAFALKQSTARIPAPANDGN